MVLHSTNLVRQFRVTPEAVAAMGQSSVRAGHGFEDTSLPDESSDYRIIELSSLVVEELRLADPELDMDNPEEFSQWIIDSVFAGGFGEGSIN